MDESLRVVGQRIAQRVRPAMGRGRGSAGATAIGGGGRCRSSSPASAPARSRFRATRIRTLVEALERRVVPSLETLLAAARQREGLEAQVIETHALRRSNVVKTALLRSVSHDLRSPLTAITAAAGGLTSETLDPRAARGAGGGDRDRERAAHAPGRQPARPLARAGGTAGAARRLVVGRGADRGGARVGRRAARRVRGLDRAGTADVRGRRGADRARARQRDRERGPLRRRGAGDDHRPAGRAASSRSGSPTAARASPARSSSGSSSPSTPPRAATGPGWGWRSRAGSSRPTAARCGRSRCPGRGRRSRSGCR